MKKLHIILLVVLAATVGVIIANVGSFSSYELFTDAKIVKGMPANVRGYLVKGKPMIYDAVKDPNYFSFTMTDDHGNERNVVYHGSKPQDFERSEQLVVKGKMEGDVFMAAEISMKCPSKYVNDEITLKEEKDVLTVKSDL